MRLSAAEYFAKEKLLGWFAITDGHDERNAIASEIFENLMRKCIFIYFFVLVVITLY